MTQRLFVYKQLFDGIRRVRGPAALPAGQDLATNNGLTYSPISQYDPNQYSQFKTSDWAAQAGVAAIFAMIARGVDREHAADVFIDGF
jgi:hypothetical protein